MTKLLGGSWVCLGVTLLVASGCSGTASDGTHGGGTSGRGGSSFHDGGSSGHAGSDGSIDQVGGNGGDGGTHEPPFEGGAGEGGAGEGGAGDCPTETFEVKWRDLHDTDCTSEGLVCHKGSDACDVGTLVASSETLTCRNGKWYWPGYNERWCCPNLPQFADSDGTACRDEGHICYDSSKEYAACERRPVIVCTSGAWKLDTQTLGECGGAGGAGGESGAGGSGG